MRHTFTILPLLLAGAISAFGAVDQGLLALAPAETRTVASIDVAATSGSEFGQHFLNKVNSSDKSFQDFIQQTGFDPRRDLQTFMIAGSNPSPGHKGMQAVILARGTFDMARISAALQDKGATTESFQGTTIYLMKDQGRKAVAFPETGVAAVGDPSSVREVIVRLTSPGTLDPQLTARIQSVGPGNDIWFASLAAPGALVSAAGPQFQGSEAIKSVTGASGGIHFGSVVTLSADADARSPQDANALASVIRFGVNMLQSQGQNDPRAALLASSLNSLDLQVSGSSVHMALSMSEKSLEQIADSSGPGQASH